MGSLLDICPFRTMKRGQAHELIFHAHNQSAISPLSTKTNPLALLECLYFVLLLDKCYGCELCPHVHFRDKIANAVFGYHDSTGSNSTIEEASNIIFYSLWWEISYSYGKAIGCMQAR